MTLNDCCFVKLNDKERIYRISAILETPTKNHIEVTSINPYKKRYSEFLEIKDLETAVEFFCTEIEQAGVGILLLTVLKITSIPESNESVIGSEVEKIQVSIERTDYAIKNDAGDILAYIYYDKPVVKNEKFLDEINRYFEGEQDEWLMELIG